MKEIKLTRGQVALVDDSDYDMLMQYKWVAKQSGSTYYAVTYNKHRTPRRIRMHNLILPIKEGYVIDHKDRNGCNNQRDNLRYASHQLNGYNSKTPTHNTSGFRGVNFHKGRYRATIKVKGKHLHIGYYDSLESASSAYQEKLNELVGSC